MMGQSYDKRAEPQSSGRGKKPPAIQAAPTAEGEGGLLVSQPGSLHGRKFLFAIWMEFLGVLMFTLFGNTAPATYGAVGNGLMLAVLVYVTANVSGGHLNPAVTFATLITGHISYVKGALYVAVQILGAIIGTLLTVGLTPGASIGSTSEACFRPGTGISKGQAFGWELFQTFILVSTVYAVAIGKPSFGPIGPFIVGVALWACASCAGQFTASSLNPARTLGPAAVFHCYPGDVWYYVLAESLGGVLAGLMSWPLYGSGKDLGRTLDHEFELDPESQEGEEDGFNREQEAAETEERMANIARGRGTVSAHPALLTSSTQARRRSRDTSPPIADDV